MNALGIFGSVFFLLSGACSLTMLLVKMISDPGPNEAGLVIMLLTCAAMAVSATFLIHRIKDIK